MKDETLVSSGSCSLKEKTGSTKIGYMLYSKLLEPFVQY